MRTVVNIEQAQAWNGYEGEHWAEQQDRWNAVNAGFNEPLLTAAAITEGDRVLDVGCGTGQTTRLAARMAGGGSGGGSAVGFDLSGPMLERARAQAADEGVANVTFDQGDAQVHPFAAGGFDVAISRFGVMFFGDSIAAFTNIGRALRPGGRLAFVCMSDPRHNDWIQVTEAMRPHLAMPDFQPGAGMFSLADPDRILEVLTAAGLADVKSTAVQAPMNWGRDAAEAADLLTGSGPARHLLSQVEPPTAARAQAAAVAALRAYEEPAGVLLRGTAWLVTAVRAGS